MRRRLRLFPIFLLMIAVGPAEARASLSRSGPIDYSEPERNTITFWGHSTTYIDVDGTGIVTDPVFEHKYVLAFHPRQIPAPPAEAFDQANIILISHAHQDHFNRTSIERFSPGTVILCPQPVAKRLTDLGSRVHLMKPGDSFAFPGGTIVAVAARHPGGRWSRKARNDGRALGYVIQASGTTIYYSGDSEYFEGFERVGRAFRPDIALLNVNVHLHSHAAMFAIGDLGYPTVVPLHFGAYGGSRPARSARWRRELADALGARLAELEVGESLAIPARRPAQTIESEDASPMAKPASPPGEGENAAAPSRPVPGIRNFVQIEPDLARGARPSDEGLRYLAAQGYRTVVGLRADAGERRKLAELGIDYIELPMRADLLGSAPPTPEQVQDFLAAVRDPARRPLFFHCRKGKDRTGVMAALYRVEASRWSPEQAIGEMKTLGFHGRYRSLARFVHEYRPNASLAP